MVQLLAAAEGGCPARLYNQILSEYEILPGFVPLLLDSTAIKHEFWSRMAHFLFAFPLHALLLLFEC